MAIKIYLASSLDKDKRQNIYAALELLRSKGFDVYNPLDFKIPHAWVLKNSEWGKLVFINDCEEIKKADFVVALNYGRRETTSGVVWECAYAFAHGKKVIIVEMTDHAQSLMVANGSYASIKGLEGLNAYDFYDPQPLRTDTEQK